MDKDTRLAKIFADISSSEIRAEQAACEFFFGAPVEIQEEFYQYWSRNHQEDEPTPRFITLYEEARKQT